MKGVVDSVRVSGGVGNGVGLASLGGWSREGWVSSYIVTCGFPTYWQRLG